MKSAQKYKRATLANGSEMWEVLDIMNNYKFKLLIRAKEIYDNLIPKQKNQFNNIQIIKTTLLDSGDVEIECLALESEIIENSCWQILSFPNDKYISVKDY